jgi:NAD(P)-dependent dehydrogenase (short-subunit alcohol dehydrogenase family)
MLVSRLFLNSSRNTEIEMDGKVIFITGGNDGIGLATALMFAKNGCNVAIMSRRAEKNVDAQQQIEAVGVQCLSFAGDVTSDTDVCRAVDETFTSFGRLDYAFNNAGVEQRYVSLVDQTDADYQQVMDVNVKGVWLCMKYQVPKILASGGGAIVNNSSVAGLIGMAHGTLYTAAKHAVLGLTKAAALEFAQQGVRINAVCPGVVETDMYDRFSGGDEGMIDHVENLHPMGRTGRPEEVASAVYYLCKDATWTTGQGLAIDGGLTVP